MMNGPLSDGPSCRSHRDLRPCHRDPPAADNRADGSARPRRLRAREAGGAQPGEALRVCGAAQNFSCPTLNLLLRGDLIEAATNLFSHLRALDASGAKRIAVMKVPHDGLGEAINDRLKRAAAPRQG